MKESSNSALPNTVSGKVLVVFFVLESATRPDLCVIALPVGDATICTFLPTSAAVIAVVSWSASILKMISGSSYTYTLYLSLATVEAGILLTNFTSPEALSTYSAPQNTPTTAPGEAAPISVTMLPDEKVTRSPSKNALGAVAAIL